MLSTEIPPDLSCPFENSQPKRGNSSITIDEKVSDDTQRKLEVVDLLKPGFVDDNPLPKFSIRDYVSSTRWKDIRTHWPFSPKNLQLCLKHGLKNVLPPFQSVDSVRNPSRAVEDTNDDEVKLSVLSNDRLSSESISVKLPKFTEKRPESSAPVRNTQSVGGKNSYKIEKLHEFAATSEHLAGNLSGISEIMTSKVCPVCKIFSSSSNTTLNAHIDQCLSGVSAIELPTNSKTSKRRIKPRKIKLMSDIYATAQRCTLEDLDRRNGTNWSSNFGFPSRVMEVCGEDKEIDSVGYKNEDGGVYVDSSGSKFLSLSKFSDLPDCGHRKPDPGNKEDKFSSGKKKILGKKHNLLKLPGDRLLCSSRPNYCPEDNYYQPKKPIHREGSEEAADVAQPVKAHDPLKSDEIGMVKNWAGSKRTRMKKTDLECDKIVRKLRVKSSFSVRGIKFTSDSKSPDLSVKNSSLPPSEFRKRRRNEEFKEKESMKNRDELPSLQSLDFAGKRSCQSFSHCNGKKPRRNDVSVDECRADHFNGAEKSDISKWPYLRQTTSSLDKKFSSVTMASVPELKKRLRKRRFNFQKSKLRSLADSDDDDVVVEPQSSLHRQYYEEENAFENAAQIRGQPCKKRTRIAKTDKRELVKSGKELYSCSIGNETSSESFSEDVSKSADSLTRGDVSKCASIQLNTVKGVKHRGESVWKQTPERNDEEASGKSFDSALHRFSGPSDGDCDSQHHMKAYSQNFPDKLLLENESEILRADKFVENVVTPETHEVDESGFNGEQGDYFVGVDPIPIPGPPGCFLPSPGHISSEELQGNSSLTTCRISDHKRELVQMDSPNSPNSSASMMSVSAAARRDSIHVNLVKQSLGVQLKNLCNNVGINPVIDSSPSFEQLGCSETKLYIDESRGSFIPPAMSSQRFKVYQPCCCSGKEGTFQNGSLSSQDSLLSQRLSINSRHFPVHDPIGSSDIDVKTYKFNFCEEILPQKEQVKANENSSIGCALALVSHKPNMSDAGDRELPSSSTSYPVFRLMGKDVMVMKKDENASQGARSSRLSKAFDHQSPMQDVYNSYSTAKSPDEHHFFRDIISQAPPIFHHAKPDISSSNGLSLCPLPAALSRGKSCGSFTAASEQQEYKGMCNLQYESGYNLDTNKHPIYESLEGKAIGGAHEEAVMDARGLAFGRCASTILEHDSRNLNPLFTSKSQIYPLYNGSQMVFTTSFQPSSSKEINTSSIKWSCAAPKDSNSLHPNSQITSSSFTGHLGSSLYFSPRFS